MYICICVHICIYIYIDERVSNPRQAAWIISKVCGVWMSRAIRMKESSHVYRLVIPQAKCRRCLILDGQSSSVSEVCIYVCICVYAHICIHAYISMYIYTYLCTYMYIYIYVCCIYIYTCTFTHRYMYIYIHIYIYIY